MYSAVAALKCQGSGMTWRNWITKNLSEFNKSTLEHIYIYTYEKSWKIMKNLEKSVLGSASEPVPPPKPTGLSGNGCFMVRQHLLYPHFVEALSSDPLAGFCSANHACHGYLNRSYQSCTGHEGEHRVCSSVDSIRPKQPPTSVSVVWLATFLSNSSPREFCESVPQSLARGARVVIQESFQGRLGG